MVSFDPYGMERLFRTVIDRNHDLPTEVGFSTPNPVKCVRDLLKMILRPRARSRVSENDVVGLCEEVMENVSSKHRSPNADVWQGPSSAQLSL